MYYIKKSLLLLLFLFSYTACAKTGDDSKETKTESNAVYFKVVNVASDDTLNLRMSASGKSKTVFKLPHNASGMLKLNDSNGWVKLSYKKYIGWAYGNYLKKISAPGIKPEISDELFCLGTEPHWILKTHNNRLTYKKYDDAAEYMYNSSVEKKQGETGVWMLSAMQTTNNDNSLNIIIKHDEQCSDEMSDNKYTYSISVNDKDMGVLNGCCNKINKQE